MDFNLAGIGKDSASTTLSETFFDFGSNRNLWIVGGQAYDGKLLYNSADFGLKYVDGREGLRWRQCAMIETRLAPSASLADLILNSHKRKLYASWRYI